MTAQLLFYPMWGLLVRAPAYLVLELAGPLDYKFEPRGFVFRTSGGWTAAFYMLDSDPTASDLAELLVAAGYLPVYFFDFSKYGYFARHWDGSEWVDDESPQAVLSALDIAIPGHDQPSPNLPPAVLPREASVIEGLDAQAVRALVPEVTFEVEAGPRGAIVYTRDPNLRCDLAERAPGRVLEVSFHPPSGEFRIEIVRGEQLMGVFCPGSDNSWGAPLLDNFEGEREPARIIELLGIRQSFLDPVDPDVDGAGA